MRSERPLSLDRRRWLSRSAAAGGLGLLGLGGCAELGRAAPPASMARAPARRPERLAPVQAEVGRLFDITVCLRPFRAAGPRLEVETIGDALVVHNYGHGGSGWSLSWGSGTLAVEKAMATSPREVAVVGGGALGLTAAILAQRAGAQVTIYAKDQISHARSARATGTWTPDSRIALTSAAAPGFGALWEQMARTAFKEHRSYLGLPGTPVEWNDRYLVGDYPAPEAPPAPGARPPLDFADYHQRIRDLTPRYVAMPPDASPFAGLPTRKSSSMMFNVADYGHTLMSDFFQAGGKFERRELHSAAELGQLREKVVINCPGYGARALMRDESIVPVRGQIGWLIPQPEVNYGVIYRNVSMLSRRDGIVIQALDGGDMKGYGDDNETVERAESESAVAVIAELYARIAKG